MSDDDGETEQRKQKSIGILKSFGLKTMDKLPRIESEEEVTLRTKEEVAERALGLLLIAGYAEGLYAGERQKKARKSIERWIKHFEADGFFTPNERAFLDSKKPDWDECIDFTWSYEPLAVMMWALGFLEEKDALAIPAVMCDAPKIVEIIINNNSYGDFLSKAVLRDKPTILDHADLIYRYHWACVEGSVCNPNEFETEWGVVKERHRALNWLIRYFDAEWDDVTTDT